MLQRGVWGHAKGPLYFECRQTRASLPFAGPDKEIRNDKQRVDRKGCDEFPLEKSDCAEYQARYDEDYQQYGNRTVHGISGFDRLNFYLRVFPIFVSVLSTREIDRDA